MKRIKIDDRTLPDYTKGEEIANMVTHIVGGAIGVVALVLCIVFASINSNVYGVVGACIFGSSMILLYTISSIYHGLKPTLKAKKIFQVLDHCTIFVLIAGTYTPIALCTLKEYNPVIGWTVFGIIWGCAIIGIVFNSIDLKKYKVFSMVCYLIMGWLIVFMGNKIFTLLGTLGSYLLIAGGISYTVGAIFYMFGKKKRYFHTIFHLFVDIGSLLHFLCILFSVI